MTEPTAPTTPTPDRRWRDDRGEGVISTAIAVLVIAFLGAVMWAGFREIVDDAQTRTQDQVTEIGG